MLKGKRKPKHLKNVWIYNMQETSSEPTVFGVLFIVKKENHDRSRVRLLGIWTKDFGR